MDRKETMPLWVLLGLLLFWCSLVFTLCCIPLSNYLHDWWWPGMMLPVTL